MPEHGTHDFDTLFDPLQESITTRTQPLGVHEAMARGRRRRQTQRLAAAAGVALLAVGGIVLGAHRGLDSPVQPSQHPTHHLPNPVEITDRPVPAPAHLSPAALAAATGIDGWRSSRISPASGFWCSEHALRAALPYARAHTQVLYSTPNGFSRDTNTGTAVRTRGAARLDRLQFDSRLAARRAAAAFHRVKAGSCSFAGNAAIGYVNGTAVMAFGESSDSVWETRGPTSLTVLEVRNGMVSSLAQVVRIADALVAETKIASRRRG